MTVLTAIPVGPRVPPELLEAAIRHALAQTHRDTIVLVAGDGERPAVSFTHDRLVVGTFPAHRGAPFTQQAMLLGSPFSHYAPHGADDWTEPDHVATLLGLRRPAAGSGVIWFHQGAASSVHRSPRTWIEFGVFETTALRSVGGYNAAEPCGQDSVLTSILLQTHGVALSRRPTYHKNFRVGSLTHDPATRQGSPIREAVKVRNRAVLTRCAELGWRSRGAIRAYREGLVPPAIQTQLEDRAADVARWLAAG